MSPVPYCHHQKIQENHPPLPDNKAVRISCDNPMHSDLFVDSTPEASTALKAFAGIDNDYFVSAPPDTKDAKQTFDCLYDLIEEHILDIWNKNNAD